MTSSFSLPKDLQRDSSLQFLFDESVDCRSGNLFIPALETKNLRLLLTLLAQVHLTDSFLETKLRLAMLLTGSARSFDGGIVFGSVNWESCGNVDSEYLYVCG